MGSIPLDSLYNYFSIIHMHSRGKVSFETKAVFPKSNSKAPKRKQMKKFGNEVAALFWGLVLHVNDPDSLLAM